MSHLDSAAQVAFVVLLIALGVVFAATALLGWTVPTPAESLLAWTEWLAKVVAIVVGGRVFWSGASWIARHP